MEHCFHTKEKGFTSQVVHLDLAGPLPESKEGHKNILGLADHFSAFIMVIARKGKSHKEVMEALINNWTYRIGPPEVLVSDNEFISQEVQRMRTALTSNTNLCQHTIPGPTGRSNASLGPSNSYYEL